MAEFQQVDITGNNKTEHLEAISLDKQVNVTAKLRDLKLYRSILEYQIQQLTSLATDATGGDVTDIVASINEMDTYFENWNQTMAFYKEIMTAAVTVNYIPNLGYMELDVGGKIIALPAEGFNFRTNDQLQLEISEWTQNEMFLELQRTIFLLEQAVQLVETQAKKRNASFRAEIDEQQVGKLHARLAQMQMDATVESTGLHIESVKRVIPEKMQWKADGLPVNKDGKWVDGGNRENLPIVQSIPELIDSLEKNQLVVLQAPTGTGKTTLATAAIRLAFKSKWDPVHDVRLHASQPSRSSTVWIGTEVAKQAKVRLGEEVACNLKARSTRSDEGLKAGPKTEQVIEVNQTMLNWILREVREFQKLPDGVIFLDEAHLGGKELFTAMTIIKYYLPFSPNTRVVVTSATLNKELYSDYYKDPDGMPEGGKIVEVEAHGGVVDVIPVVMTESEHHYQTAARQASTIMKQILNSRRYLEQGNGDILSGATHEEMKKRDPAEQLFSIVNPESAGQLLDQVPSVGPSQQELLTGVDRKVMDSGSIAVMVAGKEDVRSVINRLAEDARRNELITEQEFQAFLADNPKNRIINTDKIQILHIHGETDPKIRDLIKTPLNKQTSQIRFVIATGDIIRTSATVPELLGLVDTMEVKRPGINDQGATVFRKREITFAEVMQGVGRLSRIRTTIGGKEVPIPGNYYPVDFYDRREGSTYNRIRRENKFPKPEMCDCPLTLPTLWLAAAGISIKDCQFPLATGEEIPEKFKDEAISRLKKNGVLNANGTINEFGLKLLRFPLDPELGASLYNAEKFGIFPETVIAVSAIATQRPIQEFPRQNGYLILQRQEVEQLLLYANIDPVKASEANIIVKDRGVYRVNIGGQLQPGKVFDYFWKHHYAMDSKSDFAAIVNAYREFKRVAGNRSADQMKGWLLSHCLNPEAFAEFELKLEEIMDELSRSDLAFNEQDILLGDLDSDKIRLLGIAIAAGSVDNIGIKEGAQRKSPSTGTLDYDPAPDSACPASAPLIVYGGMPHFRGRAGIVIDSAAPIRPEDLKIAMPQLVENRLQPNDTTYDPVTGKVSGRFTTVFHNAPMGDYQGILNDERAIPRLVAAMGYNNQIDLPFVGQNENLLNEINEINFRGKGIISVPGALNSRLSTWYTTKMMALGIYDKAGLEAHADELTLNEHILAEFGVPDYATMKARIEQERPTEWRLPDSVGGQVYKLVYGYSYFIGAVRRVADVAIILPAELKGHIKGKDVPDIPGLVTYVDYQDERKYSVGGTEYESTETILKHPPASKFEPTLQSPELDPEGNLPLADGLELVFDVGRDEEKMNVPVRNFEKIHEDHTYRTYTITIDRDGVPQAYEIKIEKYGRFADPFEQARKQKEEITEKVQALIDNHGSDANTNYAGVRAYSDAYYPIVNSDVYFTRARAMLNFRLQALEQKQNRLPEETLLMNKIEKIINEIVKEKRRSIAGETYKIAELFPELEQPVRDGERGSSYTVYTDSLSPKQPPTATLEATQRPIWQLRTFWEGIQSDDPNAIVSALRAALMANSSPLVTPETLKLARAALGDRIRELSGNVHGNTLEERARARQRQEENRELFTKQRITMWALERSYAFTDTDLLTTMPSISQDLIPYVRNTLAETIKQGVFTEQFGVRKVNTSQLKRENFMNYSPTEEDYRNAYDRALILALPDMLSRLVEQATTDAQDELQILYEGDQESISSYPERIKAKIEQFGRVPTSEELSKLREEAL